jgi:hypothetical protein
MARNQKSDLFSSLRSQGLRKSVASTLADLESGSRSARANAEKLARRAIADLRSAADTLERRLDIGGAGTRSNAAKKAASTRKRAATKRSTAAKKGAAKRARKATSGARKTTARKTTARKTTGRKSTARKRSTKSS